MGRRYHITLGATTTSGGKVVTATSFRSIHGVRVACEGDSVACPACKSVGVITPHGPRLSETCNGKQVALSDDFCICKCPAPPRLIALQNVVSQVIDGEQHAANADAAAARAKQLNNTNIDHADDPNAIPLLLLDPDTGEPFRNRPYRLDMTTSVIEGTTDGSGATQPLSATERAAVLTWHVDSNCNTR